MREKNTNIFNKGFSLIELLVVIVLIAIISIIAFVNFGNQSSKARNAMRLDNSGKIIKAFQLQQVEEKIPSKGCLAGSFEYTLSGTLSGTGCNVILDGSSDSKNFLKKLKIAGTFQDPLNETKGFDDFIYEFNYKVGGNQYEFVYLTEPKEEGSLININKTYALDYSSGSTNNLNIDGNFTSVESIISPIILKDKDGNNLFASNYTTGTSNRIKSFEKSSSMISSLKSLPNISFNQNKDTSTGENNQNALTATLGGNLGIDLYKSKTYPNGLISLSIPEGSTMENVSVTVQNGTLSSGYRISENKVVNIGYTANDNDNSDRFTITGDYDVNGTKYPFISVADITIKDAITYTFTNNDLAGGNSINHIGAVYNNNTITFPFPEGKTMRNIRISSLTGNIPRYSGGSHYADLMFDYETTSNQSIDTDTITITGDYISISEDPYNIAVPFVATINISGLQDTDI